MEERQPIGFIVKQINNIYEKELTKRLKVLGIYLRPVRSRKPDGKY